MADTGNLYILAAPSGTGKTTLVNALIKSVQQIMVSISHTTRPRRSDEIDGKNYHFVTREQFAAMIEHNDFLEHATIFNNLYGTSKSWVEKTLATGIDVILEIDWQGYQQIKKLFPHSIGIFILPPSFKHLKQRLESRNQDHPEIIKIRLADAKQSLAHAGEFEYFIVNDNFEHALHELTLVIEAERLQKDRQFRKYAQLIKDFMNYNPDNA